MWLWKTFVSGSVTSWLKFCKVSQSKYSIYFEMRKMNIQGKTKKRNWLIQNHFLLRYGPKPTHLTPSCSYWWSLFCNKCIVWLWYKIRVLITWDERSRGPSCKDSYELLCCASNLNNSTLFFQRKFLIALAKIILHFLCWLLLNGGWREVTGMKLPGILPGCWLLICKPTVTTAD